MKPPLPLGVSGHSGSIAQTCFQQWVGPCGGEHRHVYVLCLHFYYMEFILMAQTAEAHNALNFLNKVFAEYLCFEVLNGKEIRCN